MIFYNLPSLRAALHVFVLLGMQRAPKRAEYFNKGLVIADDPGRAINLRRIRVEFDPTEGALAKVGMIVILG